MAYYNYHATIMQKIKSGELKSYHFCFNHKRIGYALILCFDNKSYPIKEEKFAAYFNLIGMFYQTKKQNGKYFTSFKKGEFD